MKNKCIRNQQGFTLVELLVVIAIIAILSAIAVTIFAQANAKARDARRKADIAAIAVAFEQYYSATSSYPASVSAPTAYYSLGVVPKDPQSGPGGTCPAAAPFYCYECSHNDSSCTPTGFKICAQLELGGTFCKGNLQ